MAQRPVPVFILGAGRSGTTVTASLLSRLPGVQIARETGFVAQHVALLHDIANPESLRRLVEAANAWLTPGPAATPATREGFARFCDQHDIHGGAAFLHYVWQLDSPKPWQELSFIGDNTPLYVMAIPEIQKLMPDARFIHMVRDPRDVVCSILSMRFGADDAAVAALEWHVYLGCWMMAERIVPPDRRIECRYEDLCTAPETTFARLAAFLNRTEADAAIALARHAAAGSSSTTGFDEVAAAPHHRRIAEPLSPSRIGRYKTELTEGQIRSIEQVAQYGMLAYGYAPSQWHVHPLVYEDRIGLLRSLVKDIGTRSVKRIRERLRLD